MRTRDARVDGAVVNDRRMLEGRLCTFEALVERLNAGEPFPNATLAESVQALHECAPGARDANSYTPPIDPVLLCLRQMFWALEALERGESGAAGNFVQNAREYVRLVRHRLRDSVSNETVT